MTRSRPLSDAELEDALRRLFDADRLPEIALVPTELLAELARSTRLEARLEAAMSVAEARHRKRARREAEREHTGP